MDSKKLLIAGLPESGKSTFIAALWYFIQYSKEKRVLSLESLAKGEHEYLNNICNDWLTYKKMSRTSLKPSGESVKMHLRNVESGLSFFLEIPDFSGETFKRQFEDREWHIEYDQMLNNINGILLFVSAESNNNRPSLVIRANEAALLLGGEPLTSNEGLEFKPWMIKNTPNQVKLVDILQFIRFYKPSSRPLKIIIMVSAWDILEDSDASRELTPKEWTENNLPLLYQYLACNQNWFQSRYIGISAQGGDYDRDLDKIISKHPSMRIIIKEDMTYSNDITNCIVWLSE